MIVTSGIRTLKEHEDIYRRINTGRNKRGLPPILMPLKSNHLLAAATDFSDPNGVIHWWCRGNLDLLKELGLYIEDRGYTPTWIHIQSIPPKSGHQIFIPY